MKIKKKNHKKTEKKNKFLKEAPSKTRPWLDRKKKTYRENAS